MSMGELIVILIVAILVLGPEKLPGFIVQIAKIFKALKKQVDEAKEGIEKELRISELKEEADKYKNEFSQHNENLRKKLSFEEFDELKNSVNEELASIKETMSFNASEKSFKEETSNLKFKEETKPLNSKSEIKTTQEPLNLQSNEIANSQTKTTDNNLNSNQATSRTKAEKTNV
ncbi:Sec-independent protein translocase TatB [Campylobacter troglodytis]|nr:Sec-independent protein translocase TatB [Campylobacter troglodytis]